MQLNFAKKYLLLLLFLLGVGCTESQKDKSKEIPALKNQFEDDFHMGAALNLEQVSNRESGAANLVKKHYNSITSENLLKWERIHPQPDSFNFEPADAYIEFGQTNDMFIVGHTLVWHRQTPDWVFEGEHGGELTRQALLERMQNHISTVVDRYNGKIAGWDVVNEVFEEDGSYRQSEWYDIIGEDYIEQAFQFAHNTDSSARLYYNDFNMWKPEKRDATVALVKNLQSKDIPIHGVGMQSHLGLDSPSTEQIEESILAFSDLGIDVMISELDINVTRYLVENDISVDSQLPDSLQQKLASRYGELFNIFRKHNDKISRLTFWGVNDEQSWLNYWEDNNMDNYPLLFDRQNEPKPAFYSVLESAN